MFISVKNTFNDEIKRFTDSKNEFDSFCIISKIGGVPDFDINNIYRDFSRIIMILPMTNTEDYMTSLASGSSLMAKSSLSDWGGRTTSIYVVLPNINYNNPPFDTISADQIIEIIASYDKVNATDNIWVWPIQTDIWQVRENIVANLPYQKKRNQHEDIS